jgi:Protein of unknown function (DUF2911)
MKKSVFCAICALLLHTATTQAQQFKGLDKSPMDMMYYPNEFAHDRKFAPQKVGDKAFIRLIYSRPAKKDREVFGKLIPFGKVWRLGADEATEIKFYQDVKIQGKTIKAGTYTVYAIPAETEWTIIFNTDLDQWGAYSYNAANDVLRATVSVKKSENVIEYFSMQFVKATEQEAILRMGWDNTIAELPISL